MIVKKLHTREDEAVQKLVTPSNEQKRTERGIISPPRLSLATNVSDGRA
jgi:hypothetical protein